MAASTLGRRTLEPESLHALLAGKFESAMRAAAADDGHERHAREPHELCGARATTPWRRICHATVSNSSPSPSSTSIRPSLEFFNPSNRFDAEGLTVLIKDIEDRRKLRNDIEQDATIQIRTRNLEAEKQSLEIERAAKRPGSSRNATSSSAGPSSAPLLAKERAERETQAESAQIPAREAIERARIANERADRRGTDRVGSRNPPARDRQRKTVESEEITAREHVETARILQERALKEARIINEQETTSREIERTRLSRPPRSRRVKLIERARILQEKASDGDAHPEGP